MDFHKISNSFLTNWNKICHLSDRKCNSDTKLMRNSERNTEIGFKNVDKNRIREQYKPASINLGLLLRGEKVNCSKKKVNWPTF